MNFLNFRSFKIDQKTVIKLLGIFALIFVMLLMDSGSGVAEESEEVLAKRTGTIDQVRDDKIIVNDCLFKLAPGVKFYTNSKMNSYANRSRFRKGTYVGYLINENREVTAMWLERK